MGTIVTLAEAQELKGQLKEWAYNALDCTGTREVFDVLEPRLSPEQARIYGFHKGLQAPALSMMLRGTKIDTFKRNAMVKELERELKVDERAVANMPLVKDFWDGTEKETGWCPEAMGKHHKWPRGVPDGPDRRCDRCQAPRTKPLAFNANSTNQVHHLLYEIHGVPYEHDKKHKVSTDDDALERIGRKHAKFFALTEAIRAVRDKRKQLGSLNAPLTDDNRYTSTFNIAAAWTGRFSSSKNPFRLGGNKQNVAPRHRAVFISDPAQDLFYGDYMQGESNIVAHLSGDERYLAAHLGGDVHTYVTRFIWPELEWTGDLKLDKKIAKQLPPWDPVEGHDYRFQCKRIQHGGNYGLTPEGISMIAHIPRSAAQRAYRNYMDEFPGIGKWQDNVQYRVKNELPLTNPLGFSITLLGRPWDKHTFRQGLAFGPQSTLAMIENIALWRVWYYLEEHGVYLMAQVHDALLGEYPEKRNDLARLLLKHMSIPVAVTDIHGKERIMNIGVEAAIGKNWGHISPTNPKGIDEAPIAEYLTEHPL